MKEVKLSIDLGIWYTFNMNSVRVFKYKNLSLVAASLILAILIFRYEPLHVFLLNLGNLGYIGAFIAGILFVSTFTVSIGAVVLLILAEKLSPLELGLIGGLGGVVGDFTIFHFLKDNLAQEIELVYNRIDSKHHFIKLLHTKYFSWTLPVLGAVIIASPFPDELGVSLISISKMKTYQFLIISFVLDVISVFLIISASFIFKP